MEGGNLRMPLVVKERGDGSDEISGNYDSSITPLLILSIFVTSSGTFAYGCAAGYSSSAESGIRREMGLSISGYSVFGSTMMIGGMFGSIASGKLADLIGRRWTMLVLEIFYMMGWLAIAFAQDALWLNIGRLLLGVGAALQLYVANVYVAEITPSKIRGGCIATDQVFGCCGVSVMYYFGNLIPWRTLALVGIIPCLVQALGLFFIPESPRWLAKVGKETEVEASLRSLRGKGVDVSKEATEIKDSVKVLEQLPKYGFADLIKKRHIHSLTVAIGLMVLVQLGGSSGISSYASSIFEATDWAASYGTSAMAITQLPFSMLSIPLFDKFGRRQVMMVAATGGGLGCFLVGLGFFIQDLHQQKEVTAALVLTGMLVYNASLYMGLGLSPWIIMSEIFDINMKGLAGSLVTLINWITSWIISYTFGFLFEWSSAGIFFIFASMGGVMVIFVAKLVPETKGKTLEEIQESMSNMYNIN